MKPRSILLFRAEGAPGRDGIFPRASPGCGRPVARFQPILNFHILGFAIRKPLRAHEQVSEVETARVAGGGGGRFGEVQVGVVKVLVLPGVRARRLIRVPAGPWVFPAP